MFLGVVLSPELGVVQENEENKQMEEVKQEKMEKTAEEDEIICDDAFQVETVVEIMHHVVQENEENKQLQEVEQEKLKGTTKEDEIICDDTFQVETVLLPELDVGNSRITRTQSAQSLV